MRLNEDTYVYMKKASIQIEKITCDLSNTIETSMDKMAKYEYQPYFTLWNKIRESYIGAVRNVKDLFVEFSPSIEEIPRRMGAGDSTSRLREELGEFEECLRRLIIRCENMRECSGSTRNPQIPDGNDEIYEVLSKGELIIWKHRLEKPEEEDEVAWNIFAFYKETVRLYKHFFGECDNIMKEFGRDLEKYRDSVILPEQRRVAMEESTARTARTVRRVNGAIGMIKAGIGLAKGIQSGDVESTKNSGITFLVKLSEGFGEDLPKESLAREALKHVETYHQTNEIVESVVKVTTSTISCVGTAISGRPLAAMSRLPKLVGEGMNLIENISHAYEKQSVYKLPECMDTRMVNLSRTIREYEKSVEAYRMNLLRGIPSVKPKAPPWVQVHNGVTFVSMIDKQKVKEIIGDEKIHDFIRKIL